jgi:hypothetical protein
VIYLLGADDDASDAEGLDLNCGAMLQGRHRLERGLIYFNYLRLFFGPDILRRQKLEVVPFAGHDGGKMIKSDVGVHHIFDRNVILEASMSTSLADYTVIRDTTFALSSGATRHFEFALPSDLVTAGNSKRPVLTHFCDPSPNANDLRARIFVNDQLVSDYTYSGGVGRGRSEVLQRNNLRPGATNKMRFTVSDGQGSLDFSDVVLWFKREICT